MEEFLKSFADRIKLLREERNMSLRELSEASGISKTALSYYENCQRDPALSVAKVLADYFDVDIDYLAGNTDVRRVKQNG